MGQMELAEAIRVLKLVANDPDHGVLGAYEDQDVAARAVLAELNRLQRENKKLRKELERLEKPK